MNYLIRVFLIAAILSVSPAIHAQENRYDFSSSKFSAKNAIKKRPEFLLKTNAALLGVGVANIGAEIALKCNMTLDIPLIYSPYTISGTWKLRALILQPEYRIWLCRAPYGHFFGAHAHAGFFNVATDNRTRYQDRDGNTPLWGFGVSYGYSMKLHERWGLEFNIGAGYARFVYDSFYNIANGAKFDTSTHNYWGITRLGISLHYSFFNRR